MADEMNETPQTKRIIGVENDEVVARSVQNLSSDQNSAGGTQSASAQDEYLRQVLLQFLAEEASSSESTNERRSRGHVYDTTTNPAMVTIPAGSLSPHFEQNEMPSNPTTFDLPPTQSTSRGQHREHKEQKTKNDSPAILTIPLSKTPNVSRTRDVDFEDDSYENPRGHVILRSTEEEERHLEEFQKAMGPQSAMVGEYLQPTPQDDHHNDSPHPRRKIGPANMGFSEESRLRHDAATSRSLNLPNSSCHTLMPPPSQAMSQHRPDPYARRSSHSMTPSSNPRLTLAMAPASNASAAKALSANIDVTHDEAIRDVLDNMTPIDLIQPRLTDRCRGMDYIPFRTKEELDRRRNDHVESLKDLVIRLHAAIARRLQAARGDDPRISTIGRSLYTRAIEALRFLFPGEDRYFQDMDTGNYQASQLIVLNRLLRRIDLTIRPNGPVHLETSLASWYVAALKWQIDIHEEWIAELESGKKRKRDSVEHRENMKDEDENSRDSKDKGEGVKIQKDVGRTRANPTQPRRPGRPPGSLNKSTIAAQQRRLSKEQKKRKSSLPPLTHDDVQLAQASAAEYARHSRSGLNPYAPNFSPVLQHGSHYQQHQHYFHQLPPFQPRQTHSSQYPHPRYQTPTTSYPHRRHTHDTASLSRQAQLRSPMFQEQATLRSVSNPTRPVTYQRHPRTLYENQYLSQHSDHMAIHPTTSSSEGTDSQNLDPAILHHESQLPLN